MSKKKKLLIISSGFPNESGDYLAHTFVKGFANEAKDYFDEVIVLALLPLVPKVIKKRMNAYEKTLQSYSYDNIKVLYRTYPYLPVWPVNKFKGKIAHMFLSKEVSKLIDEDTVIHANFTSPAGVFAHHLTKNRKNGFVLTVHEDHNWLVNEIRSSNVDLVNTWKNANAIIRVNKLDIGLLNPYCDNLITIPNGYDHRKFKQLDKDQCREKLGIENDKKVIVNIGFYKDQKNQKLLVAAIKSIPIDIRKNLLCYIIGGGPLHQELNEQIHNLGLEAVIKLTGQVKQDELPFYLNAADLFCLSSDSEGNPTVMFEALGVGLPYIGTSVGGVPEIITSEDYGLTCEPGDKEALSNIIKQGILKAWNKNKILSYAKEYTWKNIFLTTQKHY
ncbi:glycosyltransferase [Lutimonas halocynthiae]|uniref:glycosyltransferase n=1 Tax=Lutimonas halocynthiae TaxID=1446477 RepID=UPI0025B4D884|nr:glycosyltransferase [Lutimonas halocynthiae]MDN3643384.1 glycosyltransferase [Lutimonas halocynthiae]